MPQRFRRSVRIVTPIMRGSGPPTASSKCRNAALARGKAERSPCLWLVVEVPRPLAHAARGQERAVGIKCNTHRRPVRLDRRGSLHALSVRDLREDADIVVGANASTTSFGRAIVGADDHTLTWFE
jgi:hypothetical protein